jgi:hypothetical protein
MKHYSKITDIKTAMADAAEGKQALFTHAWGLNIGARCFRGAPEIGKLFDQDARRLIETARSLGVNKVKIDHLGRPGQHVDLCGAPLRRAIAQTEP